MKNKIGVIAGSFDIIHPGYVRMFREAKENACEQLFVLLQDDPTIDRPEKCKPVQTWEERKEILDSIRWVDGIMRYSTETELLDLLRENIDSIDVRILGEDYVGKDFTGSELNIPLYFCKRNHGFSTTGLKNKIAKSMGYKIE